jgi:hypothetical protein
LAAALVEPPTFGAPRPPNMQPPPARRADPARDDLGSMRKKLGALEREVAVLASAVATAGGGAPVGGYLVDAWRMIDGGGSVVLEVHVANRKWEKSAWSLGALSDPTDYLAIPYDGVTAPWYMEKTAYDAIAWGAVPDPADSGDPRNDALVIQISRTPGPCLYVRAG